MILILVDEVGRSSVLHVTGSAAPTTVHHIAVICSIFEYEVVACIQAEKGNDQRGNSITATNFDFMSTLSFACILVTERLRYRSLASCSKTSMTDTRVAKPTVRPFTITILGQDCLLRHLQKHPQTSTSSVLQSMDEKLFYRTYLAIS